MDDKRITAVREKVLNTLAVAEDSFDSASILYEAEKYQASLPLFTNSLQQGIKALLMLQHDELPDDSSLVDFLSESVLNKEIPTQLNLAEILKSLKSIEQTNRDRPLSFTKDSIRDLDFNYKQIESFLSRARKFIKKALTTTAQIKKKKLAKKIILGCAGAVLVIIVLIRILFWVSTRGKGLTGEYYSDENFQQLIDTRVDKNIDFDWGSGNIIKGYADDVYVRWIGRIKAPISGEYVFITQSDDGIRLWIGGKLIIDNWELYGEEYNKKNIDLKEGFHPIKVEYFEAGGGGPASVRLMWIIPGEKKEQIISPSYLNPR